MSVLSDYNNTNELLKTFKINYPTPIDEDIGVKIENRLLTGMENWNRGYENWVSWGNILYTKDSIYNVHGARFTLGEYQAAMQVALARTDLIMGDFHNIIVCDNWTAIHYDITSVNRATGEKHPGSVMEFVNFKDYGDELGTRVVEGWGGPKDASYRGMAMFRGEESRAIQKAQDEALIAWEIPDTDNLEAKYPIINPTTPNSPWVDEIKLALLKDFDAWNKGFDAWKSNAAALYASDAACTSADDVTRSLEEYLESFKPEFESSTTTRKYFDSMLISGEWGATHYRTVSVDRHSSESNCADRMQFFRFAKTEDGVRVIASWLK